jgi:hypothetical protein
MELTDLANQVDGFNKASAREKIQLFGWFLHTHGGKEVFDSTDIRGCFSRLHMVDPNVAKYLARMVQYKDLMKVGRAFKLEREIRTALDAKYGVHHSVVQVSKLLTNLPGRIADLTEKNFLAEAIKCYRVEAYRACVIMTWNLAYSHLLYWILNDPNKLSEFNGAITRRYPKKTTVNIAKYDDFLEELKESEVVEICNTAGLLNNNIVRILKEKLGKRNMAAHPASVIIVQSQADDVTTDLVNNVVLALT